MAWQKRPPERYGTHIERPRSALSRSNPGPRQVCRKFVQVRCAGSVVCWFLDADSKDVIVLDALQVLRPDSAWRKRMEETNDIVPSSSSHEMWRRKRREPSVVRRLARQKCCDWTMRAGRPAEDDPAAAATGRGRPSGQPMKPRRRRASSRRSPRSPTTFS